jgi:hypothetical protein
MIGGSLPKGEGIAETQKRTKAASGGRRAEAREI